MMEKTLITGGQASGKSTLAINMADAMKEKRVFIATAVAFDDELKGKIKAHQEQRGDRYHTIEEPLKLHEAIEKAALLNPEVVVIDCITVWLSNLLFEGSEKEMETHFEKLFDAIQDLENSRQTRSLIIVTNECGWGIIPADPLSRRYVKLLGTINKRIAAEFDRVYLTCCGLETRLK